MENKIPACIRCQTRTFMVRERSGQKAGAFLGATLGMGAAYGSIKVSTALVTLVLLSLAPASALGAGLASALGAGSAPIMFSRLIMAALSASMTGSVIGQQIDSRIRMRYRCNRCGCVVQG